MIAGTLATNTSLPRRPAPERQQDPMTKKQKLPRKAADEATTTNAKIMRSLVALIGHAPASSWKPKLASDEAFTRAALAARAHKRQETLRISVRRLALQPRCHSPNCSRTHQDIMFTHQVDEGGLG